MLEKNKKLDYYVLWSYIILDIVSTAVYLMKYDEDIFIWVVELAVNGSIFWYWCKDKDYTFRWLLFGELSKLGIYVIIAFIFYSLNLNSIFENILMGVTSSFIGAYFYQLFKIKSYKSRLQKKTE